MQFMYGISHFERDRGSFPALPLINLVTEQETSEELPSLLSRPGLQVEGSTMGVGPVTALFQSDGALAGEVFGISGGKAYGNETELGTVTGTGHTNITGFAEFVFFNAGADIYSYDGATFQAVSFPDSSDVTAIAVGASRLIAIKKDTGTFYWSDVLSDVVDPLSFATAENSPDRLQDLIYYGDRLILFGSDTVEFWASSGDQDAPFVPTLGMVYSRGIRNTGACTTFKSGFAWVTDLNEICLNDPDTVISNPDLCAKIRDSASVKLWTFTIDGMEFLALRLATKTFVYNSKTGLWSEFTSYGQSNWVCQCSTQELFGSAIDGDLYEWNYTDYSDFDGELERKFRAWAQIMDGNIPLDSVHLRLAPGLTPYLTGVLSDPSVELRISDDGGFTWTSWLARSMGLQGQYRKVIRWNSLGSYAYPGVLLEFRVTDAVPFRMSGLYANQGGGNV
jgi:hypothetical protein